MICEYDYECPYCRKVDSVSSNNEAPDVGDIEICRFCNKGGKIIYAKAEYEVAKIQDKKTPVELYNETTAKLN